MVAGLLCKYQFKVKNNDSRLIWWRLCSICSKLTTKTERRHLASLCVSIVNFEQSSNVILVSLTAFFTHLFISLHMWPSIIDFNQLKNFEEVLLWISETVLRRCSFKKGVLIICIKFTGEHPCRMVISKKLQSNFETGCFTVNLLHFFKTSVSINTSGGLLLQPIFPANIYLFKFNNRNTRKRCEICSNIDIVLVFLLWTFHIFHTFF